MLFLYSKVCIYGRNLSTKTTRFRVRRTGLRDRGKRGEVTTLSKGESTGCSEAHPVLFLNTAILNVDHLQNVERPYRLHRARFGSGPTPRLNSRVHPRLSRATLAEGSVDPTLTGVEPENGTERRTEPRIWTKPRIRTASGFEKKTSGRTVFFFYLNFRAQTAAATTTTMDNNNNYTCNYLLGVGFREKI